MLAAAILKYLTWMIAFADAIPTSPSDQSKSVQSVNSGPATTFTGINHGRRVLVSKTLTREGHSLAVSASTSRISSAVDLPLKSEVTSPSNDNEGKDEKTITLRASGDHQKRSRYATEVCEGANDSYWDPVQRIIVFNIKWRYKEAMCFSPWTIVIACQLMIHRQFPDLVSLVVWTFFRCPPRTVCAQYRDNLENDGHSKAAGNRNTRWFTGATCVDFAIAREWRPRHYKGNCVEEHFDWANSVGILTVMQNSFGFRQPKSDSPYKATERSIWPVKTQKMWIENVTPGHQPQSLVMEEFTDTVSAVVKAPFLKSITVRFCAIVLATQFANTQFRGAAILGDRPPAIP